MKKIALLASALAVCSANSQTYVSGGVESAKARYSGYEFVNPRITGIVTDNNKPGITNFNISYGKKEGDIKTEWEFTFGNKATFTSYHAPFNANEQIKEVTSHRLIYNVSKNVGSWGSWTPFIQGGLGVAQNTVNGYQGAARDAFDKKTNYSLAYAFSAGAAYGLDKDTSLNLSYQYVNAGTANSGTGVPATRDEQFKGKFVTSGFKISMTKSF